MKKIISLIMAGMMIITLTACANSTEPDNAVQNTEQNSIAPVDCQVELTHFFI